MLFVNELLTYLFKFVILALVGFAGIMCGIKFKKNKLEKEAGSIESQDIG